MIADREKLGYIHGDDRWLCWETAGGKFVASAVVSIVVKRVMP